MKLPSFLQRNKSESTLPAEIENYYQSERRERTGVAWLLAGGTLVLTLFLALGLFFGGRWVYNKVANRNPDNNSGQSTLRNRANGSNNSGQNVGGSSTGEGSTGTSSTSTQTPSTANNNRPSTPAPTGVAQSSTPAPASSALPNTGPSEE